MLVKRARFKNYNKHMENTILEKIEEIRRITGFKVNSYKVINKGAESLIIEVNNKWIFRFPKNSIVSEKTRKRWNFLVSFSKVSPIPIPKPKYIGGRLIGYKKLLGKPFYPTDIEKLLKKDKFKISKQLGLFLKALHRHKDKRIDFDTGYLVMRKDDYLSCPKELAKRLSPNERKTLNARLKAIKNNSLNFKKPTAIIHGDLNFNNILWDKNKKAITGVLDWSDMGFGIPAMDFIGIADFNKKDNDQFLKNILKWYGVNNDNLFSQIKENAIIDVINWFWFYKKTNNPNGVIRIVKKLKRIFKNKYCSV